MTPCLRPVERSRERAPGHPALAASSPALAGAALLAAGCADPTLRRTSSSPRAATPRRSPTCNFVYILAADRWRSSCSSSWPSCCGSSATARTTRSRCPSRSTATPGSRSCGRSPRPCCWPSSPCRPSRRSSTWPRREPDALEITVVGQQWWWEFDYPSIKNADGQAIVTANEMVIPAGKPVELVDHLPRRHPLVLDPRLNGKRDAVPDRVQPLRMEADEPGEYWGQCTEFCGLSHANMRIRVVALTRRRLAAVDRRTSSSWPSSRRPTEAEGRARRPSCRCALAATRSTA